jgi:signal peptidase II
MLKKLLPFTLTLFVLIFDQITKYLVIKWIPVHGTAFSFFDGFLRVIHEKNLGIAFSMGNNLQDSFRLFLFIAVPILVMGFVVFYYFTSKELTLIQCWALAGILGGGFGNIIDRIFRPEGVVDFISVRFYGLFGMEYFPTFNVADSSVVVCGIFLVISLFIQENANKKKQISK